MSDDEIRTKIGRLLVSGLKTQTEPVPQDSDEANAIVQQIGSLEAGDLEGRVILAGLTNQPWGADELRCLECMYYLPHRRWCALPELSIPVDAEWWCRLWRI